MCVGFIKVLAAHVGITRINQTAAGYELKIAEEEQGYRLLERILSNRLPLDKFEIREPSLHEIFIEKVGKE